MAKTFVEFSEHKKPTKEDPKGTSSPVFIDPELVAAVRPAERGTEMTVGRAAALVVLEPVDEVLKRLGAKAERPKEEKAHEGGRR